MATIETEDWSSYQLVYGVSARRKRMITGFPNPVSCRNGCSIKQGDSHPADTRLFAQEPVITTGRGPQIYDVDVDYAPAQSLDISGDASNVLKQPPTYTLITGSSNEPIDRDINGTAITNSAGDPFSDNIRKQILTLFYVYQRWQPQVDPELMLAYANVVNADRTFLPGFGWIEAGQGLCAPPKLLQSITRDTKAVQMEFKIELRKDGFRARILDKGRQALYAGGKLGAIYNDARQQITSDVRLNGAGTPLDTSFLINKTLEDPEPDGAKLDTKVKRVGMPGATYLYFEIYEKLPFSALNLRK